MKNNLLKFTFGRVTAILSLSLFLSSLTYAQSNKEEIEYIQSIFGMEKKVAIAEFLQLESDDAFWVLYDEYEADRKELGKSRLDILEKYANNYGDMPDIVADDLIKQMQTQKKGLDSLIDKYYKKMKKVSGSKVSAQFYQFENYVLDVVRLEILESIPFIGELD